MNQEVIPAKEALTEQRHARQSWYDRHVHLLSGLAAIVLGIFCLLGFLGAISATSLLEAKTTATLAEGRGNIVVVGASVIGIMVSVFAGGVALLLHFDGQAYPQFGATRLQRDSTIIAWALLGAGVGGVVVRVIKLTVDQRYGAGPALDELAHWALLVGGVGGLIVKATLFITPALKTVAASRRKNATSAEPTAP